MCKNYDYECKNIIVTELCNANMVLSLSVCVVCEKEEEVTTELSVVCPYNHFQTLSNLTYHIL